MVTDAGEHAEELRRVAAQIQRWTSSCNITCRQFAVDIPVTCVWYRRVFDNATGGAIKALGIWPYNITNMIEEAEAVANQSLKVIGQTLEVRWGIFLQRLIWGLAKSDSSSANSQ